jgi:nicotinate phosphoribosyltransferase
MPSSSIQTHYHEATAFEHYAQSLPDNVVLLIDTYDTETGAYKVAKLAHRLAREGITIQGVRLDSGDLAQHARNVRRILDEAGLPHITIFASGNLDEHVLKMLVDASTSIDGFGVGTRVDTSADAPYLDCAYKLEEYAGEPRRKRSEGKATWPGRKQVYRYRDKAGQLAYDVLTVEGDAQDGEPLLVHVMHAGRRMEGIDDLPRTRERTAAQLRELPAGLCRLDAAAPPYPVLVSD